MNWFGNYANGVLQRNKLRVELIIGLSVIFFLMSFTYNNNSFFLKNKYKDSTDEKSIMYKNNVVELNPRAIPFVDEYLHRQSKGFEVMKGWAKPYFDIYDRILPKYGVPKELKYLSVIESDLRPGLVSWAGAVGPWQLMDYEARRFGLKVGNGIDERKDFYKSTTVAAQLIKELYDEFGDWLLVIAAYNGGEGRVKQAIQKSGSNNFWDLQYYLKEETRNHVKKFIATHYFFEGGGGVTTMTAAETKKYLANISATQNLSEEELSNTSLIEISGRYLGEVVANSLLIEMDQFKRWNPNFDKTLASGQKYLMRIPKDRLVVFEATKSNILLASIRSLLENSVSSK